jgi:chain length determinant protein tyrosine kinase EpsG
MSGGQGPEDEKQPVPPAQEADSLGQELVKTGLLTKRQLSKVVAWQQRRGVSFREAIEATNLVSREDLMRALSQRFSYPIIDNVQQRERFSPELVVGYEPFGAAAEAVRSIRTSISVSAIARGTRSFAVIGPRSRSGATYLAGNLAVAFAQMTIPTLLVDANLRSPRVASLFGAQPQAEGLSNVLMQRGRGNALIRADVIPNLSILTSGSIPPNPQELLSSPDFLALVNETNSEFGVVIYDTAPGLDFADAFVVASRVGAAVIVARRHWGKFRDLQSLAKQLSAIQCNVIGTVMNNF